MGELWFVGLGLSDEGGLSRRAWDALRSADVVFAEEYTAAAPEGTLARIGQELGRPVRRLDRARLESGTPIVEALAGSARVALLVVGDPFAATTHVALRLAAEEKGHRWRYVPNASVLTSAAGFLGLMHYRFGRTVSLPFPEPGFAPRSPLERIDENRRRGLHTLVLLDLRPEQGRFLAAHEALAILRERDPARELLPDDASIGVVARVGRDDAAAWYGRLDRMRSLDFGPPMHTVVVAAPELHFTEAAAVARWSVDRPTPSAP